MDLTAPFQRAPVSSRRAALRLITIGASSALLAACAPLAQPAPGVPTQAGAIPASAATSPTTGLTSVPSGGGPTPAPTSGGGPTPAPTSGGTLRLAIPADLTSLE